MASSTGLRVLAYPTIVAGFAVFFAALLHPVTHITGTSALIGVGFGLLAMALTQIEISLGGKISLSPEISAVLLAFLLGGPAAAVITVGMSSVLVGFQRKRSPLRIVFTIAQFWVCVGVLAAVYTLIVGPDFGVRVLTRIMDGDAALGMRLVIALVVGTALYVVVNDAFILSFIRLESAPVEGGMTILLGDAGGSIALLMFVIPVALAVGSIGPAALLFAFPVVGAVWGFIVFARARLTGGEMSVENRLTAFFAAAVGTVFVGITAVVLSTFYGRYAAAVNQGQEAFGRGLGLALEESLHHGERLSGNPVADTVVQAALAGTPDMVYAAVVEVGAEGRRVTSLATAISADAARDSIAMALTTRPNAS
jgi:hypothetical protein